jgi:hypothetical protein
MATELTVKERAFAQLIIEGTKVAAYRKVYSDRGSVTTQTVNAYKFAKKPKIKAEVARLLRQREFPADDYARIRDVAVAGLTEIFLQESDPRLRAKVGSVLLAYADAGLKLHPVPSTKEREYDELIALISAEVEEGGKLNSEITNAKNQMIVDATREATAGVVTKGFGVVSATATRMDLMQGANEAEPAGGGDAEVRRSAPLDPDSLFEATHTAMLPSKDFPRSKPEAETGRSDPLELSKTETESRTRSLEDFPERPQYRWQAVPGRFPTVRRRVPVKTVDKQR